MSKKKKKRMRASALTHKNKFAMISITAVVCMLFGVLLYGSCNLEQRLSEYRQENEALQAEYQKQEDERKEQEAWEDYKETEEYKMNMARKHFALLKDNEIFFKREK